MKALPRSRYGLNDLLERNVCFGQTFPSYTSMMTFYEQWQWDMIVAPIKSSLAEVIPSIQARYDGLQRLFLHSDPIRSEAEKDPLFYTLSAKKQSKATARRFALGTQARGTRLNLKEAQSKTEHVAIALECKHPATLVTELLEPTWRYVFNQTEASFRKVGATDTWNNINSHRDRMMSYFRKLSNDLTSFRTELVNAMPEAIRVISGHLHIPLFYVLLVVSGYPNPDLAWRFATGSPILGTFDSPALLPREKLGISLSDENIRDVARECQHECRNIRPRLSPAGARKCMDKIYSEIEKKSLVGPFPSFAALCAALQREIRLHPGCEDFILDPSLVILGPTFTVEELHAWMLDAEPKIRNIWNGRTPNKLTSSYATYVPNNHADVSTIVMHWIRILEDISCPFNMLAFTSDFTGAYRQMPLRVMHLLAGASCFWNYDTKRQEYVFYRSLPFGSSLAPAGWSEVVLGLCHILAISLLVILTHCVDDICGTEVEETVHSARNGFLELCSMIGLVIDMSKSPEPIDKLVYLGLQMVTPARIPRADNRYFRRYFQLSVTKERRDKLISGLKEFLEEKGTMTCGEASSWRGKLMFYCFWHVAARSYLSEFAARQYNADAEHEGCELTEELCFAIQFFLNLLESPKFLEGIRPETLFNREMHVMYTDGALEGDGSIKGIGGVLFPLPMKTPLHFGEMLSLEFKNFDRIAPIEMHAIYRAFQLFGDVVRGKAVLLFVDNTHAIGCLLKRSATIKERGTKRSSDGTVISAPTPAYTFFDDFCSLDIGLRRTMNEQARAIWDLVDKLDVILWIEYVKSDNNIADPPSRGEPLPMHSIHISERHRLFQPSSFQ